MTEPFQPILSSANMANAVVALMIKKGGTLRLKLSELRDEASMLIWMHPSPNNPDVVHITAVTPEQARQTMMQQLIDKRSEDAEDK